MLQYRFYNLEKDGQAVIARIELTLHDAAAAVACAKQLIVGEEIQVWQGSRLDDRFHEPDHGTGDLLVDLARLQLGELRSGIMARWRQAVALATDRRGD